MKLKLSNVSYEGPKLEEFRTLETLPEEYGELLALINGFIQFGGGLHIRGICREPEWHALDTVRQGPLALVAHYPKILESDVPFGQDAMGDQLLLRENKVIRLFGETGEIEPTGLSLNAFLESAQANPIETLQLQPLAQFYQGGQPLEPGQLLNAYPPFSTEEAKNGVSLKAIPALDQLRFLENFYTRVWSKHQKSETP